MDSSLFIPKRYTIGVSMLRIEDRPDSLLIRPLNGVFDALLDALGMPA